MRYLNINLKSFILILFIPKYSLKMEEAIVNYRGAAEKTFNMTMPGKQFKDENDESIGIFFNSSLSLQYTLIILERRNLRLTCPFKVKCVSFQQVREANVNEVN